MKHRGLSSVALSTQTGADVKSEPNGVDLRSVAILSIPRHLYICTFLLSNQMSSSTVSTPTHWTLITPPMCSGKLLRSEQSEHSLKIKRMTSINAAISTFH